MKKHFIRWAPLPEKIAVSNTALPPTAAQIKTASDEALLRRANADTPFDIRGNIHEPARQSRLT